MSAYRTLSKPAVMVIAGVIPIAPHAAERKLIYLRKSWGNKKVVACQERARTLCARQQSWEKKSRRR